MKSIALLNTTGFNVVYKNKEDKIDSLSFSDKTSLLDYDIAIIGINHNIFYDYYTSYEHYAGHCLIGEGQSAKFQEDLKRRKEEIRSLLDTGRNVYFIMGDDLKCYYYTYQKSVSGTGRNAKTTNYVNEINVGKYLIDEEIDINYAEGKNINVLPDTKLTDFGNKLKKHIYYKSYFKCKECEAAITTSNQDNYICGIIKSSNGHKVLLPEFVDPKLYNEKQSKKRLDDVDFVIQSIKSFDDVLNSKDDIPAWVKDYCLSNEEKDVLENKKLEEKIKKLKDKQEKIQIKLSDNFKYKKLLYASGTELENIVKELFEEFGFELLKSRPNRSDVNLKYEDKYFVCEVKGLTKSAAEKNSNQLQKWETEFFEDYEVHPKQILLVNGFKNIPLIERTEEVFPNQMLDYATKKEQCLMTTTQLLCIYLHWLKDNSILDKIFEIINNTNGVYSDYNNCEDYIQLISNLIDKK